MMPLPLFLEILKEVRVYSLRSWAVGRTAPVDIGYIDWTAQFRALAKTGYSNAVNLETHWKGGGTPEASTRRSWEGMKKDLQQANAI